METVNKHRRLVVAWLLVNLADYLTTWRWFSVGGKELNPLLANVGFAGFTAIKIIGPVLVVYILYKFNRLRYLKWPSCFLLGVVLWLIYGLLT